MHPARKTPNSHKNSIVLLRMLVLHCKSRGLIYQSGISLYPDSNSKNRIILKPALSWYTKVIQVKNVPTSTKVGYGGTFKTNRPSKIAVIPVGYWDGYDRRLSNKAYVLVRGAQCQIVGRICMNHG